MCEFCVVAFPLLGELPLASFTVLQLLMDFVSQCKSCIALVNCYPSCFASNLLTVLHLIVFLDV
jgi:hypothetical protein